MADFHLIAVSRSGDPATSNTIRVLCSGKEEPSDLWSAMIGYRSTGCRWTTLRRSRFVAPAPPHYPTLFCHYISSRRDDGICHLFSLSSAEMKSHFIALLLLIAIPRLAIAAGGAPTINLGYVQYTGFQNATIGINYYRGLRYAQAPVGDLRWREPVPIEQSSNYTGQVMDASQYGPACYQGVPYSLEPIAGPIATALTQSEDCLLLDVLVPINPVSASLPVYVQIHGGGYTLGSSSTVAPGDAMVNASNGNIIYVQIQYRLGMHGFLGGSQVAQDGVRNAGLLDQRAALLWVQRNIRPFGGDPAKVTIIGIRLSSSKTEDRWKCGRRKCYISTHCRRCIRSTSFQSRGS